MARDAPEPFRGHFDECFAHFLKHLSLSIPKGSKRADAIRKPIADFCGVTPATVARWIREPKHLPVGAVQLKAIEYLKLVGYQIIEFDRLSPAKQHMLELIAFGVLTPEVAASMVGYSGTTQLYRVLHGTVGSSAEGDQQMWEVWKSHKDTLQRRKEASSNVGSASAHEQLTEATTPRSERSEQPTGIAHRETVTLHLMRALLVLLEEKTSPIASQSRTELHPDEVSVVLKLSARLSTLSSLLITEQNHEVSR